MHSFVPKSLQRYQVPRVITLLLLVVLLGFSAVPGYLTGRWSWTQPPRVVTLDQLKAIQQQGLSLPGWQTLEHQTTLIGGRKWSLQEIRKDGQTKAVLLLFPQNGPTDQPQVEWMDINGFQQQLFRAWTTDSYSHRHFQVKPELANPSAQGALASTVKHSARVEARFFRGWNPQQTFAILQWYAWPQGGHPAPNRWFWADRLAQWQKRRVPWVAVSILIPTEPLGNIDTVWPVAESLGQLVQATLMAGPLGPQT